MNKKKYNICFAGGGTGGHVKPIQALLQYAYKHNEIISQCENFFWFGENNSLEEKICKEIIKNIKNKNLTFISIFSGKFRREKTFKAFLLNIRDLFLFIIGIFQSFFYINKYNIGVIFCKGGFVALPVVIAGRILGKKIFTHESDTRAGIVNTISSKFSIKNFTGFPNVLPRSIYVGQILSDKMLNCRSLLLVNPKNKQTNFLILGGSQGSQTLYQTLNTIFREDKEILEKSQFFIVGGLLNKDLKKLFLKHKNLHIFDFLSSKDLGKLYFKTDVAITRGGATSLEEMQLFNIKKIIIPIPRTHDQKQNANWYVKKYGDIILDQEDKDFEKNIKKRLFEYSNYKKDIPNIEDITKKINKTKEIIRSEILK